MKIFYNEKQVAKNEDAFSPSAYKPKIITEYWKDAGLPVEIIRSGPVSEIDLCLAHNPAYVQAVLNCKKENGFYNKDPEVAESLPYTSGSLYHAAKNAIKLKTATCSPTSGFHHAGYDRGGGYCTFNGLVVTALKLKTEGLATKVGILDCDQHYGNGTDEIIEELGLKWIDHLTVGARRYTARHAEFFLRSLPDFIRHTFAGCEVILYQAGADPHVDDPLGGWLTTKQLAERDRIVFETLKDMKVPVAWNFAGGYQKEKDGSIPKVIEIHTNTLLECLKVYSNKKNVA